MIAGRSTVLFCARLAWSEFGVIVALWDRTMPSVVMALDRALRAFGGAPTYALPDNEKTVSVDHVAGIAVRNPQIVAVARHYGVWIETCVPADPQSKGGSEATVWSSRRGRQRCLAAIPVDEVRQERDRFSDRSEEQWTQLSREQLNRLYRADREPSEPTGAGCVPAVPATGVDANMAGRRLRFQASPRGGLRCDGERGDPAA